jgi:hypothetical protein
MAMATKASNRGGGGCVPSPKEISNQWNGTTVYRLQRRQESNEQDSRPATANRRDLVHHEQVP